MIRSALKTPSGPICPSTIAPAPLPLLRLNLARGVKVHQGLLGPCPDQIADAREDDETADKNLSIPAPHFTTSTTPAASRSSRARRFRMRMPRLHPYPTSARG